MAKISIRLAIVTYLLFSISTIFAADTPPVKLKLKAPEKPTRENVKTVTDPTTGMQLVFVKGGCYQMGETKTTQTVITMHLNATNDMHKYVIKDSRPIHEVCLSDFYLGKYEVTQSQWEKVMGNNPSEFKLCGPDCPVENITWNDAQEFIKKLNVQSGKQYRMPTEAEWEYAARSGGKDEVWAGTSDASTLSRYAWNKENSKGTTHKVGLIKSNGLGLYDMSGNVKEWCQDWYNEGYYDDSPKDNPSGPENGEERVIRGGAWLHNWSSGVSSHRNSSKPDITYSTIGVRLLLPAQ